MKIWLIDLKEYDQSPIIFLLRKLDQIQHVVIELLEKTYGLFIHIKSTLTESLTFTMAFDGHEKDFLS